MRKKELVAEITKIAGLSYKAEFGLRDLRKKDLEKLLCHLQSITQLDKIVLEKLNKIKYSNDLCKDCVNFNDPTQPGWRFEEGLCKVWKLATAKKEEYLYAPVVKCVAFNPKNLQKKSEAEQK